MPSKPKLLLISAIPPFPQTSGGANRIYHTIVELSKKYSIYFITFNSDKNEFYSKYTSRFINLNLKPKTLFSPIPYYFSRWYTPELKTLIPQVIHQEQIDLVQVEFSQLLYISDFIPKNIKTRFISHDISSISFYRRIFESKNIIKIISSFFFWLQICFYEKKYLPKFDKIYTVSNIDQQLLQKHFQLPSTVSPNGIATIDFIKRPHSKVIKLGYIGSFSHPPNKFAVDYFLKHIAPQLTNYQFILAGNNSNFKHENVTNLGIVKNIEDFYKHIDVLVAPIFSGSGTRIKILETLSFGIPVISTTIGAEGIDIKSDYLQIANNPQEFKKCIYNLPNHLDLNLKKQLKNYLWQSILCKL